MTHSCRRLAHLSFAVLPTLFLALACGSEDAGNDGQDDPSAVLGNPEDVDGDGAPDMTGGSSPTGDGDGVGDGDGDSSSGGAGSGGGGGTTSTEEECLGDFLIEDFEDSGTYLLLRPYNDGTPGGTMNQNGAFTPESAPDGNGVSLHMQGSGFSNWGAGIGRAFDAPVDCKGRSTGIRFRAKGPGTITVAAPVSAIVPVDEGGSCTAADACNNGHEKSVTLSSSWATYEVRWSELQQLPGWGLPATFDAKSVVEILFASRPEAMPFNYWIDDLELIDDGTPVDPGTDPGTGMGTGGGGGTNPSACVLDEILGEQGFLNWFSTRRNSFYTYENLCTALEDFPGFADSGNPTTDKQEVAAFFANVARETGELEYIEQIVKDPPTYFGRGPIQLTHSYNYRAAGDFLGIDLVSNPGLVASDGVITWQTALWFWMHSDGAAKGTCNGAIVEGRGFGQTINIINGGLECGGENTAARQRITYYEGFCSSLGVSPGSGLTCW